MYQVITWQHDRIVFVDVWCAAEHGHLLAKCSPLKSWPAVGTISCLLHPVLMQLVLLAKMRRVLCTTLLHLLLCLLGLVSTRS